MFLPSCFFLQVVEICKPVHGQGQTILTRPPKGHGTATWRRPSKSTTRRVCWRMVPYKCNLNLSDMQDFLGLPVNQFPYNSTCKYICGDIQNSRPETRGTPTMLFILLSTCHVYLFHFVSSVFTITAQGCHVQSCVANRCWQNCLGSQPRQFSSRIL